MDDPIQPITREVIVQQVRHAIALGTAGVNPYHGTEHEAAWDATVARLTAEEIEGGESSA